MVTRGYHPAVAAIGLGTAYSGFAFSARHDFETNPTKITIMTWNDSSRGLLTLKTPTCALFDASKKFHSFGFEAEDKYADLAFEDKHKKWYFFKQFVTKMTGERNVSIEDELGKSLPAIDVFSASIGYLKSRLMQMCRNQVTGLTESDIMWVVTVPAIWNEEDKRFMYTAAEKAGITCENLLLASEPDAASFCCSRLNAEKLIDSTGGLSPFTPGSKYIVLDAGGMTVRITVYEVESDGTMVDLYHTSLGTCGGTYVDQAFLRFISEIVGADVMTQCKEKSMIDMLDLLREFEVKKRTFKPEMCGQITLKVPVWFNETFEAKTGSNIKDAISSTKYTNQIRWIGDKLRVDASVAKYFFTTVTDGMMKDLQMLFKKRLLRDIPTILMVGGFSNSPMLQKSIREHFPDKRIIIPEDADVAFLKGAVIYGHGPSSFTIRKERSRHNLLVAALDFGTAFSGYAFSTRHDFETDPTKISTVPWYCSSRALQSSKTPTCVLFDANKKFHSFGYEAEDKYAELAFDDKHKKWYFFKQFKMDLFNKMKVQRQFSIEDELGKSLPAIDVFSASIGYLKGHLLKTCRDRVTDIRESDILWVITVPAIWNEAAKQFMREAAGEVGIIEDELVLALEPEAASLFCRSLKVDKLVGSTGGLSPFNPGSKYLVLDAGGGTVDITVHEVLPDGTLAELYRASGGNWGGTYVDQAFLRLLSDIVGKDVMAKLKEQSMVDMLDLLREFEVKKRTFKPEMDSKFLFKVPVELNNLLKAKTGKNIKDILSLTKYSNQISWISDKMRVEATIAKDLFTAVITGIVQHLQMLFKEEIVQNVPTILMVGGFSESPMLQTSIQKHFPDKRIIIPEDAGLAILKGAVIYGHDPSAISERRCRYTYGFSCKMALSNMEKIKAESIPEYRKVIDKDGIVRIKNTFDKHVTIGQQMGTGKAQNSKEYSSIDGNDFVLSLYASTEPDPIYTTEPSCILLGTLNVDVEHLDDTCIQVSITFSDTELLVEATKNANGDKLNAKFRLLDE